MPGKLKVVLGLYAISLVLNVVQSGWLGAVYCAVVIGLLFKGSETMRKVVVVLAAIGLVLSALGIITLLGLIAMLSAIESGGGAAVGMSDVVLTAVQVAFGIISAIYTIWALTRQDVKDWMIAKSAGAAAAG